MQNSHKTGTPHGLWATILAHWALVVLLLLTAASFLLKALPLLQYPRVGGDPFVHYQYSMALLNGKLNVPVNETGSSGTMELYYPPLFHAVSLGFFLALPTVDPFTIMKLLASAFDALQIIPIYLVVKRVSGSDTGGLLASYALVAARNDYQMLSWGGYANIAGLLLAASLVYVVITERLVLSAVFSAALGLTHHLSTLFMIAVLVPYFALFLLMKKRVPKCFVGVIAGGAVAYVSFYSFAWQNMLYYYSNFSPNGIQGIIYSQSQYVTPYIYAQVGSLLLLSAAIGLAFLYAHGRRKFFLGKELLLIWAIVPILLSYAYLLGVEWHGVRWIAFIPEPLAVWVGVALGMLDQRKLVIIAFVSLATIQLVLTIVGYHSDILSNVFPTLTS